MDLKVLNEGSESKLCIVAAGNNSPFANVEARTSTLDIRSLLHNVDSESDHFDNEAKVLRAAI